LASKDERLGTKKFLGKKEEDLSESVRSEKGGCGGKPVILGGGRNKRPTSEKKKVYLRGRNLVWTYRVEIGMEG